MTTAAVSSGTKLDPAAVASQFPILSRVDGGKPLVYLDSGATAQKPAVVIDRMAELLRHSNANIHRGVYPLAQEATDAFEDARRTIAAWIGAAYEETLFAKNVTEAINLVAYSWGRRNVREGDRVLISQMEHHSNIVPWQLLCQEVGATLDYIEVRDDGTLDLDSLDAGLARGPKLVAVTHVSNVLGTVNPVEEIVRRAHDAGAVVLIDGAQAAPHYRIDVKAIGADFYGFTGHKLYGPTGVGVLYGRRELLEAMPPFLAGGDMIASVDWQESRWNSLPWKFEAGTSPYIEAAALGTAVEWFAGLGIDAVVAHERELVAYALERLAEVPGLTVYGPQTAGPHRGCAISFAIEGVHPHDVAEILARDNICIRAGHHCAQPLMRRLGVPATTRASFAAHNSTADIDKLVESLGTVRSIFGL
jgi:cysteine desulfurase/selenocysteine lyase